MTGVAGVGKSRLGWEFEKYIDGLAATVWWHRGRCLSYGEGVAFWALAEMVRQRLQIAEEDPSSVAAGKLAAGLVQWLNDPAEREYVGPRLAQLLGVDYGEPGTVLGRDELFAGWRLFFERLAAAAPVVMVVEDLQHTDAGLLDFLEHLLDWARDVPIFVLTLARPEVETRRRSWGAGLRNSTALTLDPLDEPAMDALLEGLVPGMPSAAKTAIAGRAEGIGLYAVETVRMLIDRDVVQPLDGVYRLVGDVGELSVPATLQSLLAARLDSLDPDARRLVADAAVLGSSFPADALVAVSDQSEGQVRRLLDELVHREVLGVRADPLSPQRGHYGFVQTMFRSVAYDTLSRRERKARHLAVAAHLRSVFADEGEEMAEVIATHLLDALTAVPEDADVPHIRDQAVGMLTRAGDRAERTGAPATAATTYATAATLLERTGTAEGALAAAALGERAGASANNAGEFPAAVEHYQQAAKRYREHEQIRDAARADTQVGAVLRRQGRLEEARTQISGALEILEADSDADTVNALAELASVNAFAGHALEADRVSAAALAHAQALDLSDAIVAELFIIRGIAHALADRPAQAAANLREAVRRAQAAQDSGAAARALLNLGDALTTIDPQASVEATRTAMTHGRRLGLRDFMGYIAGNLIQALLTTGEWSAGEEVYRTGVSKDGLGSHRLLAASMGLLSAFAGDQATLADVMPLIEEGAGNEDPQDRAVTETVFAAAATVTESYTQALHHAKEALDRGAVLGVRNDGVRWAWPIAADAALALRDDTEVARLLAWLDEHPPGHIPPVLRAERLRIRARQLAAQNDPAAAAAFDTATQAFRQLGSPYHLAVELLDQAEYLANDGDVPGAHLLAIEADAIADGLGAKPLLERARRVAESAPQHVLVASTVDRLHK